VTARVVAAVALGAALAAGGCAGWSPFPRPTPAVLERAHAAVERGDYDGALTAYDDALRAGLEGETAVRARAARDTVAAVLGARAEVARLRAEAVARDGEVAKLRDGMTAREDDLTRLREEVARLRQELAARQAELVARQAELAARQTEITKLTTEAERLRTDLELLKSIDMRLERRRP
jgi:chromosome segregation ATPase